MGTDCEHDSFSDEEKDYDGCPPATDGLEAGEPGVIVPSAALEHRPEAVVHVEPESDEADDVDDGCPHELEGLIDEVDTVLGIGEMVAHYFSQLHLGPELNHVDHEEGEDYDTEHEHVLRCPFNLSGFGNHSVAVVAAGLAVLDRQPHCIEDVDDEEHSQSD